MAHAPPTPPPTTDIELRDEAQDASIAEPSFPATDGDTYTDIFPTIADLASQSNFRALIQTAENSDLCGDVNSDQRTTRLLVTAPLVLSYLIIDDLPPARYALTRLPDSLLFTPLGQSLIGLVASTIDRKHADVYSQAESLVNLVHQSDFFDPKLSSVVTNLITMFIKSFRSRTFALLSKAYTSLPFSLGQRYLGLNADELLSVVENNQWSYDASNKIISPRPLSAAASIISDPTFSSLSTFHFVVNSVAKLEL